MLLAIEARIGELLPTVEEAYKTTLHGGVKAKRPEGINRQRAYKARTIARHPAREAAVWQSSKLFFS